MREPIAIVGIGCRFPGGADGPEAFWRLLTAGIDAIDEIPPDRFDLETYFDPRPSTPGKIMSRRGGFLDGLDRFDAAFFGMSPREAERLDPQQRLLLELAWEALEDAGQDVEGLRGSRTGVYAGLWVADYEARLFADPSTIDFHMTTGTGRYAASGRVSFALGLQGPSMTIDTACSSSLVAVHLACRALWDGECDLALAGGVNLILQPHITIAYSQPRMMAPDGRCKFGDAKADGYVRSEGAGMIALKPAADAVADGDPIYAVVRGSAVGNDGQSSGKLGTPGVSGQETLVRQAWRDAGITADQLAFIEAHGTGTRAGDPVELEALGRALGPPADRPSPCPVGSVKTNIGHTEAAAGVAGLIKATLALQRGLLPLSLHLEEPTRAVDWHRLGLAVAREPVLLPDEPARVAGVNSFGISGTNAHVVLGQASANDATAAGPGHPDGPFLLPLSARAPEALPALASAYRETLTREDGPLFADVCYTAARRRTHHEHRLALAATDRDELMEQLGAAAAGELVPADADGRAASGRDKIVFVFPGQGSQWPGMGRELLRDEPVFRTALESCDRALRSLTDWSLLDQLRLPAEDPACRLDQIDVLQPTLLAVEIALAAVWRSLGVAPDAVVGHSMGEVAAAHVAGALSLDDAMRVIATRSRLLRRVSGRGAMATVELSASEAETAIAGLEDRLSVAVANSPRSTVVAGDADAVDALVAGLEAKGVFCRRIKVDVASHSPQMDALTDDLLAGLEGIRPRAGTVPILSTTSADVLDGAGYDAAYWVTNLRRPVRFADAVGRLVASDHRIFIECSPHPILCPAMEQGFAHARERGLALPSLRRDEPERATLLRSLGALYERGQPVDWRAVHPSGRCVRLPRYPWQRERFWIDAAAAPGQTRPPSRGPVLGHPIESATGARFWRLDLRPGDRHWLGDHRIDGAPVLPAAAIVEAVLEAARQAFGAGPHTLAGVAFSEAVVLDETAPRSLELSVVADRPGTARFRLYGRRADEAEARWILHCSGTIRRGSADRADPPIVGLPAVRGLARSGSDHYAGLDRRRVAHGPAFRSLQRLWFDGDEAGGELALPLQVADDADPHLLHPVLLDGGFQLLAALLDGPTGAGQVPVGIDRLEFFGPPGASQLAVHVRRRSPLGGGDVVVADRDGRLIAAARGVHFQPLRDTGDGDAWRYELRWQDAAPPTTGAGDGARWLVVPDRAGLGGRLAAALSARGVPYTVVEDAGAGGISRALAARAGDEAPVAGVAYLAALDPVAVDGPPTPAAGAEEICADVLEVVAALNDAGITPSPRLVLVTRGAQADGAMPGLAQAPLWGLGAVIANEHPELACTRVDLDPAGGAGEAKALAAELVDPPSEDQVALRDGGRRVARLVRFRPETAAPATRTSPAGGRPYRLETDAPGRLDRLVLRGTSRRPPHAGEVEIAVRASGLNFIDVMKAMGVYPGQRPGELPALGVECAGVVAAVGEGVTGVEVGDEVVAVSPSMTRTALFATSATVPGELVARMPAGLSAEEAATLPIAYLTASYALDELARLAPGERVLISSAAGGVGLAAVQVAREAGAEVFATAGTLEKRAYLRDLGIAHVMDSRSLEFAEQVAEATGGEGVDVVLNSLAGEAIPHSLALLAPYGRFVEIGKTDLYGGGRLPLEPFTRSLTFFTVDLARLAEERQALVGRLLRDVLERVSAGRLSPLPLRAYPASQAADAFQRLAQGRHIGKCVLTMPEDNVAIADASAVDPVRADASYLITGGLGALGLAVARWLTDHGARHLVLVGRRSPSPAAQGVVDELSAAGVDVRVERADVEEAEAFAAALASAQATMPPLRGIVHAAGVLDDALVGELDRERLRRAMGPKARGAWNLHELTRGAELDFFVLFSSVAAVLGIPGQGNYAAGNAFLDALARVRRAEGRPALSIAWGPWGQIGLAAADARRGERLVSRGLESLPPGAGLAAFGRVLGEDTAHVAIARFDLERWREYHPGARRSRLFSDLEDERPASTAGDEQDVLAALAAAQPGQGRALLQSHVREQVARVLRLVPSRVALGRPFKALGMDSLLGLELRNRIEASLGHSLSATVVWNYPTVSALTDHLAGELGLDPATDAPVADAPGPGDEGLERSLEEVEALLDDELLAVTGLLDGGEPT